MKTIKRIIPKSTGLHWLCQFPYKWLMLIFLFLYSCGKDKDVKLTLEDGYSTVIYDLPGDTEASMGSRAEGKSQKPFDSFLFRFLDKRQIWIRNEADSNQWLKSKNWDIAFTGPYNSEIFINNANDAFNPGYEGPAIQSAVILLKQSYSSVQTAPSDAEFDSSPLQKIGWAATEFSEGWYQYNLSTHIMQAIPNRTYAIRLPDGKYAKLQLINVYKGNPPAVSVMTWPTPYYTFRYYVQQDGTRNLQTQ